MPVISDPVESREVLAEARELGVAIPSFCAEDERTQECILLGAMEKGAELGVENLPVMMACTANYPSHGQMKLYTRAGIVRLGLLGFFSYLDVMMSEHSPYRNLRVLPCLDHGIPELDTYALNECAETFSIVMFDGSEHPLEENMRTTAEYVEKTKGRVLVEGCVDHIVESGDDAESQITSVADAERFVSATGVDLIVANLGTEHRAAAAEKKYHSQRAREISNSVGRILCLHGTSCLKDEELPRLAGDGIIKVNIYTILAQLGGQAVAHHVLKDLGNMFTRDELEALRDAGYLGNRYFSESYREQQCGGKLGSKLAHVAEVPRRDVWVDCVKEQIKHYMDVFNYRNYGR
ncbi:MAG TPA: class II fructose-bisphosphate aldolase [Candidatus Hydrogenedentes bacterium]|nr:class II fructose-bisphosphate aldolase [Candidatus Hydrogenedentota bacterium]